MPKLKANPKTLVMVQNAAGEDIEIVKDEAVPVDELHVYDAAGTRVKVVNLGGDSGRVESKKDAHHKPRR